MAKTRRGNTATRSRLRWLLVVVAAGLVALIWLFGATITGYARIGAAYSARVACSCHFVAGRSMESCATDRLAGMELINLSADDEAKSMTARFPLLASDTARLKDGYGCVLDRWEE